MASAKCSRHVPCVFLALTWYLAVGYPEVLWNVRGNKWTVLSFLVLGFASARLAGPRRRSLIDVPLDGRMCFALFTGFLLRGLVTLLLNCPELSRISHWLT